MFTAVKNKAFGIFFRQGGFRFILKRVKSIPIKKRSKCYSFLIVTTLISLSIVPGFSKSIPTILPDHPESTLEMFCLVACTNQKTSLQKLSFLTRPVFMQKANNLVETVMIEKNASPKDLGELLIEFRKAGIKVDNRINRKRRYNWIKDIHFHFQHRRGLNFKVKVTGFQKLVFQFVYDEQKNFKYFTFRINDEEVYSLVEMDIKGFKNYVCYDTGLVVMGETNEDIVRVY